jgi:hypothetical protein
MDQKIHGSCYVDRTIKVFLVQTDYDQAFQAFALFGYNAAAFVDRLNFRLKHRAGN